MVRGGSWCNTKTISKKHGPYEHKTGHPDGTVEELGEKAGLVIIEPREPQVARVVSPRGRFELV